MNAIFILVLVCLAAGAIFPAALSAQSADAGVNMYLGASVGDTLPVFTDGGGRHARRCHAYVFIDARTCFTCTMALGVLQAWITSTGAPVDATVFVCGKGSAYADRLRRANGWSFPVIADPVYAYRTLFAVKARPVLVLTDEMGRVLGAGKCGGDFGVTQISAACDRQRARWAASETTGLREAVRVAVVDSTGQPVVVSPRATVLWSERRCVIYDPGMAAAHVVDNGGHVVRTWNLIERKIYHLSPFEPSWALGDSVLLCPDISTNPLGDPMFSFFNVNTGEATQLGFSDTVFRPRYYNLMQARYLADRGAIAVGLQPRAYGLATDTTRTLLLYDGASGRQSIVGPIDDLMKQHAFAGVLYPILAVGGDGCLYVSQSPTRRLDVYGHDGQLRRSLHPSYGSTRHEFVQDLDSAQLRRLTTWVEINQRTSQTTAVFPNHDGSRIAVVYVNTEYPNGCTDPHAPDMRLRRYLHRMDGSGRHLDRDDIELPPGSIPFALDGSRLGVAEPDGDFLDLVWYALPEDLVRR